MKKITTILFDLDGTLIRMDQDRFIEEYFVSILGKFASLGFDVNICKTALEGAVVATLRNNGECTNEERFWKTFYSLCPNGESIRPHLDDYYANDFPRVIASTCEKYPRAREVLDRVKKHGFRSVLATNPLFPMAATSHRMELGGISESDFEYVTAYENSSYCKPNPDYFTELLEKLGIDPDECVMIGNDTRDDFSAHALGIPVFVLTECLINKNGTDLSTHPHGGFDELIAYIDSLA